MRLSQMQTLKLNCLTFSPNLGQWCAYIQYVPCSTEKKEQAKVFVLMPNTFVGNHQETIFNLANTYAEVIILFLSTERTLARFFPHQQMVIWEAHSNSYGLVASCMNRMSLSASVSIKMICVTQKKARQFRTLIKMYSRISLQAFLPSTNSIAQSDA